MRLRILPHLAAAGFAMGAVINLGAQSPADRLLAQGASLALSGRMAEAEATLKTAAQQAPDDSRVLSELAKVEGRLGKRGDAIALFRRVVALQGAAASAHENLALALADDRQMEGALTEASAAVSIDAGAASPHVTRALILSDAEQPEQSRSEFEMATRLDPTRADAWFFWAQLEIRQQDEAKAAVLLKRVVLLQPRNAPAFTLLGKTLQHTGRQAEACDAWRKSLAIDPDDGPTVYLLSQALRRIDPAERTRLLARFQDIQQRKQELDHQGAQVSGLGNQAYLAMERQDWATADTLLRQAIDLCGQCALLGDLRKNLGLNACHRGDLAAGKQELTEALRLKPSDPDIVTALTWIEAQQSQAHSVQAVP